MTQFGHDMLLHWSLDPEVLYLNHGTVGAPPRRVLEAQQKLRDEIERQPSKFMLRELSEIAVGETSKEPRMRVAAQVVAEFMGAEGRDLVFVDNATTGVNAVLRSLQFHSGDEILVTNLAYGGVANAIVHAARQGDVTVRTVNLPVSVHNSNEIIDRLAAAITPKTRLAILDHITSESALVMPVEELIAIFKQHRVRVLVDGAHVPAALPLDLPALGADWYTGNLHKWAYAPRSCGFLWAPPERQKDLHPAVISWGLDQSFTAEFDWVGTRDPTPYLAAPEGINLLREWGEKAVRDYNHQLVWDAARMLCTQWSVELVTPESMIGTMVALPLPEVLGSTTESANQLRDALLFEDHIELPVHATEGRLWMRICAQVYNEMADYEQLARSVLRRL